MSCACRRYWNTPESELNRILTDCNGERHPYSIPRGLLRCAANAGQRMQLQQGLWAASFLSRAAEADALLGVILRLRQCKQADVASLGKHLHA